jgi:predicted ATP-grasp superfamily ATP-dependent carboligase
VCNGRPFKTYFGTSYLDDSFFYTHQFKIIKFKADNNLFMNNKKHIYNKKIKQKDLTLCYALHNNQLLMTNLRIFQKVGEKIYIILLKKHCRNNLASNQ